MGESPGPSGPWPLEPAPERALPPRGGRSVHPGGARGGEAAGKRDRRWPSATGGGGACHRGRGHVNHSCPGRGGGSAESSWGVSMQILLHRAAYRGTARAKAALPAGAARAGRSCGVSLTAQGGIPIGQVAASRCADPCDITECSVTA